MGCFGYMCKGCGTSIRGNCWDGGENCVMIHVRHGKELGRVEGHYDEYGSVIEIADEPEDTKWRGDVEEDKEGNHNINCHRELCDSEFNFTDSYTELEYKRIFKGELVELTGYIRAKVREDVEAVKYDITALPYYEKITKVLENQDERTLNYLKEELLEHARKMMKQTQMMSAEIVAGVATGNEDFITWNMWDFIITYGHVFEYFGFKREFFSLPVPEFEAYSGIVAYHKKCYDKAIADGTFRLIPSKQDPDQSWGEVREEYV